jgi:precorrin-6Y C5,15-methyltransferase (decarboxylating)
MLYVIGMGLTGRKSLSESSLKTIERAGLLAGGARHLREFPEFKGRKVAIGADLVRMARTTDGYLKNKKNRNPSVVVATGDPSLFGIADFLVKRFGKKKVRIIPNVSPVQEAFARIKENWNGCKVLSVHGREGRGGKGGRGLEGVVEEAISSVKAAVFTDPVNTPGRIARELIKRGASGYTVYVCEALGTKKERIIRGTLKTVARRSFNPLNIMVLIRDKGSEEKGPMAPPDYLFGIPDRAFSRSGGMITKEEVRVITLAKLRLERKGVVWDIGSGSGSIAVEAARFASRGTVYAVEKDKNRVKDIEENIRRFNVTNLMIIPGTAPGCLKVGGLPAPDRVFIGGGGGGGGGRGGLSGILNYVSRRVKKGGIMVINAVTIDTLSSAAAFFKRRGWCCEVVEVSLSRTKPVGGLDLLSAGNPVFIISARKP